MNTSMTGYPVMRNPKNNRIYQENNGTVDDQHNKCYEIPLQKVGNQEQIDNSKKT